MKKIILFVILLTSQTFAFEFEGIKSGKTPTEIPNLVPITEKNSLAPVKDGVEYFTKSDLDAFMESSLAFYHDQLYRLLFVGLNEEDFNSTFLYFSTTMGPPKITEDDSMMLLQWVQGKDSCTILYWIPFHIFTGDIQDSAVWDSP